jgi:hypothetical protein
MRAAGTRLGTFGAVIAAVLVVLVVLAPTLLFGQSLRAFDLVLMGASLISVGLLIRWRGGARARDFGTTLGAIGAVILVLSLGLLALLVAGWGRGY